MSQSYCDKACEILQATNDGDKLSPNDLGLLESAVNGWLSEAGEVAFCELHKRVVIDGDYAPPWLAGAEHLTINHEGYVYWKGQEVEHYTTSAFASPEVLRHEAHGLAQRCRTLESLGVKVSCQNAVWFWERYAAITMP